MHRTSAPHFCRCLALPHRLPPAIAAAFAPDRECPSPIDASPCVPAASHPLMGRLGSIRPSEYTCAILWRCPLPQVGAWAALQEAETACTGGGSFATLVVDTEGMLAATENEAIRARLLLKMLAICDVCLFTTKAERLHSDMFLFLERASKVW